MTFKVRNLLHGGQGRAAVRPALGWLLFAYFIFHGMDHFGLRGLADARPLFWCMGLLVAGSIYAINELHALRQASLSLQADLGRQYTELQKAVSAAHETAVERDMVEDALQESQTRFYHLSEASFEAICIHDNGVVLDANQNLATLYGGTIEQLSGHSLFELCPPEERARVREAMQSEGGEVFETTVTRRDGSRIPVEIMSKRLPYNGRKASVVAIRDLTLRRRMEAERAAERQQALSSEAGRKALLETSVDGILVFDDQDRIVDVNPAAERVFGWERGEFLGRELAETVVAPSHRLNYKRLLGDSLQGKRGFLGQRVKVRALRRNGSEFDSEVSTTAIHTGGRVEFVAAVRDISERMATQRGMEAVLARMQALVENLQAGILVLDSEQHLIMANRSYCRMFHTGTEPEGMLGLDAAASLPAFAGSGAGQPDARAMAAMVEREGMLEELEDCDGRIIERQYIPAMERGVFQGHLWIYRDVSHRKRAEAELEGARDAALDSARFKSQFLANMSHEIRTPMNAIVGMTDLLLESHLSDEQKDFASTVKQASESLLGLINQVLDFSKIEAGKLALEHDDFDLRELMEGVAGMFAARAQAKGVELKVQIPQGLPTLLRGDSGRLGQVLVNLVGNAVKFTEKGGVLLSVGAEEISAESAALKLQVSDSGIGMDPETLQHLFVPFVQADGSITRRFGGTGLGLAISKELVELMGGTIGVESSASQPSGSRFWAKLSLERRSGAAKPVSPSPAAKRTRFVGVEVLVAEDNSVNQRVVRSQMQKLGAAVHIVDNGEEALKAMALGAYDLVLMDCQMPVMDGLAATRARRAAEAGQGLPRLPIVAMTANALEGDEKRCLEAGMDDYLPKPVKLETLGKVLERWVGSNAAVRDEAAAHDSLPVFSDAELRNGLGADYRSQGAFQELIDLFAAETPGRLERLESSLALGDAAKVGAEAHAVKGSCLALGAMRMADSCAKLEALANQGAAEGLGDLVENIKEEYAFALRELVGAGMHIQAA